MSGLELNKIAAAILLAALVGMISGKIADLLYQPILDPEKRGYQVEITNVENNSDQTPIDPMANLDIETIMKSANADAGQQVFKKCLSCHTINKGGPIKVGPNLWNIVGASKISAEGFSYSAAMKSAGGIWDLPSLFKFLHKPQAYIKGTKMSFIGLNNPQDIANVIAYLMKNSDKQN
jgi:cytochrome c